ncbi:MAG: D-2-hydroxyacid dehydrogenase [Ruminococcaceae bacterium]|nr:D-2-hydroxyacid dehydrogenase [Oscillospiraceae bacterium]
MKIVILLPLEEYAIKKIEELTKDRCEIIYKSVETVATEDIFDADAILGNLPPKLLKDAKKLKWLQSSMAGTDAYLGGVLPEGVKLTNVTGAFGLAISEHMVATVFTLYKKLHLYRDNQNRSQWLDRGTVKQIEGSTVLTVGLGDIGGNFAKKMKALGAYTIGVRRKDISKPDYIDELVLQNDLDKVLPRADIVALALPNTAETKGLFNRERIYNMKDGATLINVGRGNAVDTEALCDALEDGKLYAASLDVTDPEPLPSDHRMWKIENALITPHISGFFHLRKTYENIVDIFIENLSRFLDGKELENIIDMDTGYRKK